MRDSIVFYRSFYEALRKLPPDDFKQAAIAIMEYGLNDTEVECDGVAEIIFTMARPQIDANIKRAVGGAKGGRPTKKPMVFENAETKKPMVFENDENQKPNVNVNDNVNVNIKRESKEKKPRFSPPTLEEAKEYANEHGYTKVDVEHFIDYYTGNGWMVGKNKMKDWKACLRNWNRSQRQELTTKGKQEVTAKNRFNNFSQRGYDYDQLEKTLLSTNGGMNE